VLLSEVWLQGTVGLNTFISFDKGCSSVSTAKKKSLIFVFREFDQLFSWLPLRFLIILLSLERFQARKDNSSTTHHLWLQKSQHGDI